MRVTILNHDHIYELATRIARARVNERMTPDRERHALDRQRPHRDRAIEAGIEAKLRRHFTFFLVEP